MTSSAHSAAPGRGLARATGLDAATLLETEAFAEKGGWVVDQQFMDQMGSPFLLAHGLGKPVADAVTKVTLAKGEYKVWVRTRDWAAPQGPGRFKVVVPERFGELAEILNDPDR